MQHILRKLLQYINQHSQIVVLILLQTYLSLNHKVQFCAKQYILRKCFKVIIEIDIEIEFPNKNSIKLKIYLKLSSKFCTMPYLSVTFSTGKLNRWLQANDGIFQYEVNSLNGKRNHKNWFRHISFLCQLKCCKNLTYSAHIINRNISKMAAI